MRYKGGKAKIARYIVSAIMEDTPERGTWFEPFVGGGSVLEKAAPHFDRSIAMDAHEDLMLMWQAVKSGWEPPRFISREEYAILRHAEPSALRGFAGFGAAFGGVWFHGYGVSKIDKHHPVAEVCRSSYKVVMRQGRIFQDNNITFIRRYFGTLNPPKGAVVYCDPPYKGTSGYTTGAFDWDSYYKKLVDWADSGCHVYASEYAIPTDIPASLLWSKERRKLIVSSDNQSFVTENLYRINTR